MPRQESIAFHFKAFVVQLHNKGRSQVNEESIADVGKKRIRKAFGIGVPKRVEVRFPEKINEMRKRRRRRYSVVAVLKMFLMKEFYVLHRANLQFIAAPSPDR